MSDGASSGLTYWIHQRRVPLLIGLLAAIASIPRLATLAQPLVEAHEFRQTQTAYAAVIYHREGIDLLRTPLPVLGPPWVVPFEFPLFQAIAALVMDFGVDTEVALRATSLAFFLVSAGLVWQIVRVEAELRAAAIATTAFVLAPLGILWSRTSTIETMAVAMSLAAVLEAVRFDRTGSRWHLVTAAILGLLAGLVKITTAAIWLAPALFFVRRSRVAACAIVAVSAIGGLAWTLYADGIKAASPATTFLTSAMLRDWNFGSLGQRLDPGTWVTCLGWLAGLGLLIFLVPLRPERSRLFNWAVVTVVLGPLLFTNLYVLHDYYWMAVAPAVAILVGLFAAKVLEAASGDRRRSLALVLVAVFALSFIAYPRWALIFRTSDSTGVLAHAAQIASETDPDDLLAISHDTWNPAILFYADRRGYMVFDAVPAPPSGYIWYWCPNIGLPGRCIREADQP